MARYTDYPREQWYRDYSDGNDGARCTRCGGGCSRWNMSVVGIGLLCQRCYNAYKAKTEKKG